MHLTDPQQPGKESDPSDLPFLITCVVVGLILAFIIGYLYYQNYEQVNALNAVHLRLRDQQVYVQHLKDDLRDLTRQQQEQRDGLVYQKTKIDELKQNYAMAALAVEGIRTELTTLREDTKSWQRDSVAVLRRMERAMEAMSRRLEPLQPAAPFPSAPASVPAAVTPSSRSDGTDDPRRF